MQDQLTNRIAVTTNTQSSDPKPDETRDAFRMFADLSLRIKLIFVFLVVTLLAVGIIALLNIRSTNDALTTQVSEGLASLANSEAQNIGTVLAKRVEAMQAFTPDPEAQAAIAAQNAAHSGGTEAILAELTKLDEQWIAASDDDPLVQERLTSELARELENITIIIPDIAEAFLTDRHGGLVAASGRTSDYYQADEGWWQAAYNDGQGAVYIGQPELGESTGTIGIEIAMPVYDQSSKLVGILRTTLDATALVGRVAAIELGKTGRADLLVGEEVFEAHPEEHEGEDHRAIDPAALAQIVATPEGYVETIFGGQPALIGYATVSSPTGEQFIPALGWKVIVHQDQDEALAVVAAHTRNTGLLTLIMATIVVVVAVGLGQVLANPIAHLTRVVTRFTEGDLSARIDIDSRDETGVLAASFNKMADQVGGLLERVQVRGRELEERIRELEASQRVTVAASERVSPDELLGLVVNLIRDQFDLYHVQVYIVDEEQGAAVLRDSTGYAGRQLLQRGHQIPLDRPGLVTTAIRQGQPVLVDDVSQDPDFMANPLLPDAQSELVVPLKVGERVLGALDAQDREEGRFSESTVALFQTMADQISFLFENSELLERVAEQTGALTLFTNQLRTAADIAHRLGAVLDPECLLEQLVEMMQSRFGLYHAHIYVLDEAKENLIIRAGSGEVGRVLREQGHSIPLDREQSLVARAARTQEIMLIEDTSLASDFMPNPLLPQTRSEMAVPLIFGDSVVGVLDVQDDQPGRFSQADRDTFMTLAGQVATALQNAGYVEEIQETAERLREVDRLKSEFLAHMSHEIRTPLNSILGYTEVMLMGIDGDLDPETAEDVQAIHDNGQHLLRLISDILDLAKIEAGRMTLNLEEVEIAPLLEEVKTGSAGLLVNKPVEMILEVDEDLPSIQADRTRISQIMNNLVSNAAKFTEEGRITLRAFGDEGWVCFEVEDTGGGISEADLETIFEQFRQGDGSFKRRAEGTGLGLSITRHLVHMHGGAIDVRSQVGEGSTFSVRLPALGPESPTPSLTQETEQA